MPVKKFRTFEEAEMDLWNFYPDSEWIKKAFRIFLLSRLKKKSHIRKGITKFRTFEEARNAVIFKMVDSKNPVCGLDMLIKMKETVRDRDLRDLRFLKKKAEERKPLS